MLPVLEAESLSYNTCISCLMEGWQSYLLNVNDPFFVPPPKEPRQVGSLSLELSQKHSSISLGCTMLVTTACQILDSLFDQKF